MSFLLNLEAMTNFSNAMKIPCRYCKKDLNTGDGLELLPRIYAHLVLRHPEVEDTDKLLSLLFRLLNATKEELLEDMMAPMPESERKFLTEKGFLVKIGRDG